MTDVSMLDGEGDAGGGQPAAKGSFYRALVGDFLVADPSTIIGQLSSGHVAYHASAEREQVRAWEAEIALFEGEPGRVVASALATGGCSWKRRSCASVSVWTPLFLRQASLS